MAPAQLGKWLVLFCDEINLPDLDKYGKRKGDGGEGGREREREGWRGEGGEGGMERGRGRRDETRERQKRREGGREEREGEGEGRKEGRGREAEKIEERRMRRQLILNFFPVARYPEGYIIYYVRLLSMEGSTGRQITRG